MPTSTLPDGSDEFDRTATTWSGRLRRLVIGPPRDIADRRLYHRLALVPLLAWIGLGADGLSSSAYGPEEAFVTLGEHRYLAVALAVATAGTVLIIAAGYSRIIEAFPQGGGGYVVGTALLGSSVGVVSGCALLIDYVLTIAISIAAAGAALFSFIPPEWHAAKVPVDLLLIVVLTVLNLRGTRESVLVLTPIFAAFAITHLIVILGGVFGHVSQTGAAAQRVVDGFQSGFATLGAGGMLMLFLHAYCLGGGTYTGIEAVSNGLQILREPRVRNGKRTMAYMAISLAFCAAGLLLLYLLWDVQPQAGQTLNAVLVRQMTDGIPGGIGFAFVTLLSEAALLVVAAQAGFMDGPRVLANMAVDSWMPHRFAALSERLTAHNGIAVMSVAALAAVWFTRGDVRMLVVLYSINVFITFTISMFGMLRRSIVRPGRIAARRGEVTLFVTGFLLCATILAITIFEKFFAGGWLTLLITGSAVAICFAIRRHYDNTFRKLNALYRELENVSRAATRSAGPLDPMQPTAAVLVGGYGGLGIHTVMNIHRVFPGHFKNMVFLSVGVLDSGEFKGENSVEALRRRTEEMLERYVKLAQGFGIPATSRYALGTDVVEEAEKLCLQVGEEFPQVTYFAGKVIFQNERWYQRLLHNETAYALQTRLHWRGRAMMILPARVT